MTTEKSYVFKSSRLGFRNWIADDLEELAAINADPLVMEFFPSVQPKEQAVAFIQRMQHQFAKNDFCYFAVDRLDNGAFIGFIGLSEQTYEAGFTPCVDIGWRLKCEEWNHGFATEGAKRCLEYAFKQLDLKKVVAVTPIANLKSEQVMIKIGMKRKGTFKHSLLKGNERLEECVLYEALAENWKG